MISWRNRFATEPSFISQSHIIEYKRRLDLGSKDRCHSTVEMEEKGNRYILCLDFRSDTALGVSTCRKQCRRKGRIINRRWTQPRLDHKSVKGSWNRHNPDGLTDGSI